MAPAIDGSPVSDDDARARAYGIAVFVAEVGGERAISGEIVVCKRFLAADRAVHDASGVIVVSTVALVPACQREGEDGVSEKKRDEDGMHRSVVD